MRRAVVTHDLLLAARCADRICGALHQVISRTIRCEQLQPEERVSVAAMASTAELLPAFMPTGEGIEC